MLTNQKPAEFFSQIRIHTYTDHFACIKIPIFKTNMKIQKVSESKINFQQRFVRLLIRCYLQKEGEWKDDVIRGDEKQIEGKWSCQKHGEDQWKHQNNEVGESHSLEGLGSIFQTFLSTRLKQCFAYN